MGEICEVCGEACPLVEPWHMGGAPGEYEEAMAAHWRLGYEREKARADAAEREHERTKDALGDAFKELREAQSALAAARRECEGLRAALNEIIGATDDDIAEKIARTAVDASQ